LESLRSSMCGCHTNWRKKTSSTVSTHANRFWIASKSAYELLPYGKTLNLDLYCQQLAHLKAPLMQKRPSLINRDRIVFYQDNARPHTSLGTRQLRELGREVLLHPQYSPDLEPSDYHLFLYMANALGSLKLATRESCENWLSEFFANRVSSFFKRGIMKLASRWERIIEQNAYLSWITLL